MIGPVKFGAIPFRGLMQIVDRRMDGVHQRITKAHLEPLAYMS